MRLQHEAAARSQQALQQDFFCGGDELENDTQAMRSNIEKARRCWARISRVLRRTENATAQVSGVFYKATVMAVLLFGSETWSLAPSSSLKRLEGFHLRAAWRMAGKGPWLNPDGSWTYPDTGRGGATEYRPVCGGTTATHLQLHCQSTYFRIVPGRSEEMWVQSPPVLVGPAGISGGQSTCGSRRCHQ